MKSLRGTWFLSLAIALHLTACANTSDTADSATEAAAPSEIAPRLVGRISSIRANPHFVLIQSYGTWDVETGSVLSSRGEDGRTANLLVTGERSGQYAAADVQAGLVEVGDTVFSLPPPSSTREIQQAVGLAEPEATPPDENPEID